MHGKQLHRQRQAGLLQQSHLSWRRIAAALAPVIGPLGVRALLQRSVFLLPDQFATCFGPVATAVTLDAVLAAIEFAAGPQSPPNQDQSATAQLVAQADTQLRQNLSAVLGSLVGPVLCRRLLAGTNPEAFEINATNPKAPSL